MNNDSTILTLGVEENKNSFWSYFLLCSWLSYFLLLILFESNNSSQFCFFLTICVSVLKPVFYAVHQSVRFLYMMECIPFHQCLLVSSLTEYLQSASLYTYSSADIQEFCIQKGQWNMSENAPWLPSLSIHIQVLIWILSSWCGSIPLSAIFFCLFLLSLKDHHQYL